MWADHTGMRVYHGVFEVAAIVVVPKVVQDFAKVKPGANFAPGANPNINVNMNQQNKHIVGTNENKTANSNSTTPRSLIEPKVDVQKLVNDYAGTGDVKGNVPLGQPGSKENISADRVIGQYYDHNTKTFIPTKNFTIHYSKKGVHIVPARP